MLVTQVIKEVPELGTVFVAPYDDSELNLKLAGVFEAEIVALGKARVMAESSADFMLLFESEVVPAEQAPRRPSLGSVGASAGLGPADPGPGNDPSRDAESKDVEVDVNVNVWSSSKDSVLGGRQQEAAIGGSVFHINAILRNRRSDEVVWQGDAYYPLSEPDTERVALAMVAPLVDKIGQSVVREPFEIE
jgi:hypothetical protein